MLKRRILAGALIGGALSIIIFLVAPQGNWGLSFGVGILLGVFLGWSTPKILVRRKSR